MLANKALWVIERHLGRPLTLSEIAGACGVSKYHLAHAFGTSTGLSAMQYVPSRRLTVGAQLLTESAPDVLAHALDSMDRTKHSRAAFAIWIPLKDGA